MSSQSHFSSTSRRHRSIYLRDLIIQPLMTIESVNESDYVVVIRRAWNNAGQTAKIPLSKIQGLHWDRRSGGIRSFAPRAFIHGYVICNEYEGNLAHTGVHGKYPHQIKICITKIDNEPGVFQAVKKLTR